MIDLKVLSKIGLKSSVVLSVAALSCGATYFVCDKMYEDKIADLEQQVDNLEKKELQARVTQRISEQMEGIASQQTLISNQERDKAEEQKRIADIEKGKAEIEKGLAMEAQQKALASADEAQRAQKVAEQQTKIATENMLIAETARNHADTLMYISLANSLAQSSLTQYDTDLSRLLSYSSWYYSNKYQANVASMSNVYKSLLQKSGSDYPVTCGLKGTIRRLHLLNGTVIAFTDYGEAVFGETTAQNGKSLDVKRLGDYDFRDFVTEGKANNTVLSVDGRILSIDLTKLGGSKTDASNSIQTNLQLPKDLWYRLISIDGGKTLVAMGEHTVSWINANTFTIEATRTFNEPLSNIGMQGNILHIFCKNVMTQYVSDKAGVVATIKLNNIEQPVTAYYYDDVKGYQILGTKYGLVYVFDNNGQKLAELSGHNQAITDLYVWGALLGATSNDASMALWNINDLSSTATPVTVQSARPLCFEVDTDETVWIADGTYFTRFCSSAERNANAVQSLLSREFTDEEWNHYIGKGIDKVKFMKK